jgi:L-malate glycosyltransferase
MKILQVFADWKWTGPSEPILIQTKALLDRGHEVILSVAPTPEDMKFEEEVILAEGRDTILKRKIKPDNIAERESIAFYAEKMGVSVDTSISWDKRTKVSNLFGIKKILKDIKLLRRLIDDFPTDIVSAHSSHDHFLAVRAIKGSLSKPLLVRTDHSRNFISGGIGNRYLMNKHTDGVVTFSKMGASSIVENFKIPRERIKLVDPALNLEKWNPKNPTVNMRLRFNIPDDAIVIGMVARFQKYRKTDVAISAFSQVAKKFPNARLLLIGRSSQMEESVFKPARKFGVEDKIITPGYLTDDYIDTLKSIDIFLFMMPGSDGTARALREAMALGLPVAGAREGMIPEIIQDGVSGLVMEPNRIAVEAVLTKLLGDGELRAKLGRGARERALSRFDVKVQAERIEEFFRSLLLR